MDVVLFINFLRVLFYEKKRDGEFCYNFILDVFRCARIPRGCERCDDTCAIIDGKRSRLDYLY